MAEALLGRNASYLRRLGALTALLCGAGAVLGLGLLLVSPSADALVATAASALVAGCGAALSRAERGA